MAESAAGVVAVEPKCTEHLQPTAPRFSPAHPIFRQHRCEIERFARLVAGGFPAFCAQIYSDLWKAWPDAARPDWLRDHLANLGARYAVPLSRQDRGTSDR